MPSLRPIIYTPSGSAAEYANHGWACNLYPHTCPHHCLYCYNLGRHGRTAETYFKPAEAAPDALARLEKDCRRHYDEPIFLEFLGDPYPTEFRIPEDNITRRAIEIIKASGNCVRILTKGRIPALDMGLLGPGDEVGVTLTSPLACAATRWEPGAVAPAARIINLALASEMGIKTWASFEPVIDPAHTLEAMAEAAPYLNLAKIGKLNHPDRCLWPSEEWRERVETIDWRKFALDASALCERLGLKYYLKADLRRYLEAELRPAKHRQLRPERRGKRHPGRATKPNTERIP